ncbi:CPBP family intramembrane metalloprotease [Clostridium estertheticum]|uniref:CPBP family intramembrane glutamic endopeptidase n=1 Tax=Clostridium estertheticum TaxID=238834 RepID=UPI001C0D97D3|nr:CPBP family intramembrane glutamic endopeptidase [Clostridium estertheticum]MBU3217280.1 CPBP family intramembrane metalloprotease [Clostridium estertheticum]WAG55785.1 CPBP family intramembrane metalloprotease [Clostridium estertheticum]
MNRLKSYAFNGPVIFSAILIIVTVAFTFIPLGPIFSPFLGFQAGEYITGILEQVIASLFLILILKQFDLFKIVGFTRFKECKSLWIVWPMIILSFLNGAGLIDGSIVIDKSKPFVIILFILTYLSTGLFEEVLCRGVVLGVILRKWGSTKKGCYLSVILSSVLFGSTHIVHFLLHHFSLLASLTQITYGTFIGVFFAACVLRNKSIYPAIMLHAIFDILGSLREIAVGGGINTAYFTISIPNAIASIIVMLPILIYGLFILRKVKPSDLPIYTEEKFKMV